MKTFKDFMTEAPTFQHADNPALSTAGGFADPAVIMKINALMGHIIKEDQLDPMGAVSQIRNSLSKLGLTFDQVKPFTEENGEIELPLTLFGGRFGKDGDTPYDQFLEDDGLSHMVEGGLKLTIKYEKTEHNACRMRAEIK